MTSNNELTDTSSEDPPHITFKTKTALLSLITMYESNLFTLKMPAAIPAYVNADLGPDPIYPWITVCWNLGAAIIVTVDGRLADSFVTLGFMILAEPVSSFGPLITVHVLTSILLALNTTDAITRRVYTNMISFGTASNPPFTPRHKVPKVHSRAFQA
ncbi:hypothetical protein CC80DRAFT_590045 [Byssothecium circinans]|uniref:MFS general substrate transporter n=1 Tax=Byssothecium circinans TaxID=147558 RepID=A0A6A5U9L4_9PLEO|nr:hypothetical protein CC80DRAFT_590045 [Byssothecium circinans]